MGWELETVEKPLVEQLLSMGWQYVAGDLDDPARTGRRSFSKLIQEATLRHQRHAQQPADLNWRPVHGRNG